MFDFLDTYSTVVLCHFINFFFTFFLQYFYTFQKSGMDSKIEPAFSQVEPGYDQYKLISEC